MIILLELGGVSRPAILKSGEVIINATKTFRTAKVVFITSLQGASKNCHHL